MTSGRFGVPGRRRHVDELDPELRDRILALDEPVSREDWADVLVRAKRSRVSGRRLGAFVVLVAAALGAAVFSGPWLSSLSLYHSSGRALAAASDDFFKYKLGEPPIAPEAIPSETRVITSRRLSDGDHTLYVSPAKNGGFCYRWTGSASGCDKLTNAPFSVDWGKRQVIGTILSRRISSVKIKFTNGSTAKPLISWISAPINAGFFLYNIPAGKTVLEINMK